MKMLRHIVCAGSSGGGKTTLAAALGRVLNVPAITHSRPGAAAVKLGYARPSEVPADQMLTFQRAALEEQVLSEYSARTAPGARIGAYVADRGTLDFAAYYLFQTPGASLEDEYVQRAVAHARTAYDLILYVPPLPGPVEDNGVRHLHGVAEVDGLLRELLGWDGIRDKVHMIASDGPENRVKEVLALFR